VITDKKFNKVAKVALKGGKGECILMKNWTKIRKPFLTERLQMIACQLRKLQSVLIT
jgi:hypothetical protein